MRRYERNNNNNSDIKPDGDNMGILRYIGAIARVACKYDRGAQERGISVPFFFIVYFFIVYFLVLVFLVSFDFSISFDFRYIFNLSIFLHLFSSVFGVSHVWPSLNLRVFGGFPLGSL